ncbi:hypothetical protein ACH0BF_16275 [Pseudobacillus sp. 179-B 2D1 NHS]|uniref:hypothetical protein n=1 Tax=Pseudobacillus sp. 179-B 2D1 NHS TaxID=3374292 RepID=UPI00387954C4
MSQKTYTLLLGIIIGFFAPSLLEALQIIFFNGEPSKTPISYYVFVTSSFVGVGFIMWGLGTNQRNTIRYARLIIVLLTIIFLYCIGIIFTVKTTLLIFLYFAGAIFYLYICLMFWHHCFYERADKTAQ